MIDVVRLKQLLDYDSETGLFKWRTGRKGAAKDARVGSIRPDGYQVIRLDARQYRAQRLAMFYANGVWPTGDVDHINGDKLDNRLCNLRDVPTLQNQHNKFSAQSNGQIGIRGVKDSSHGTFVASISAHGHEYYLGSYATPEEASNAYLTAKSILHPSAPIPRHTPIREARDRVDAISLAFNKQPPSRADPAAQSTDGG